MRVVALSAAVAFSKSDYVRCIQVAPTIHTYSHTRRFRKILRVIYHTLCVAAIVIPAGRTRTHRRHSRFPIAVI